MERLMFGAAAALVLPLAACMAQDEPHLASTAAAPARQCFDVDSVTSFDPVDRDVVDVRIGSRRSYRLHLAGGCEDADWASRIALRSRSGRRLVCSPLDAELIIPSTTGSDRCLVTAMRPLTQAEIEAGRQRR